MYCQRLKSTALFLSAFFALVTMTLSGCNPAVPARLSAETGRSPLITAMLDAYGGSKALSEVRTVVARGRINDDLRQVSGGYARIMQRPGSLRIEIRPEQGGEIRVLAGDQGWQGAGDRFYPAKPISLSSMRYQYSYLDVPMCLADLSCTAQEGGIKELEGRLYDLLLITAAGAPQLRVYVDRDSHLIHRVAAEFSMGTMGSTELATEYADFRAANGVLFPRLLTNFAGGSKISLLTIETLEVNGPLAAEVFIFPALLAR
ncbi:MAG: hypothetical protein CVU69_03690 [Deltaproteobacteria bacterium HGW-Deltaproteobacteria-4]|nr:MAG: hypothetical protein CVU69_03690 [Deltaproteobacteria bacterium HGW-Deltaproteobacteria-4]